MNVSYLGNFCKSFLNILMPNLCFVCQEPLPVKRKRLCPACFDELELLDPTNRCPLCFDEIEESCRTKCLCSTTHEYPFFLSFCFHPLPTVLWLQRDLKTKSDDMIEGIAAFMHLQLISLHWPQPDLIIPYGPKNACTLSKILAQTLISKYYNPFFFSESVEDKTILIIAPFIHSRGDINPLVEKLITRYPKRIFILGLHHL